MTPATKDMAIRLADAFGLPKRTRAFSVHFEVNQPVIVRAEVISDADPKEIVAIVQHFDIQERKALEAE